MNPPHKAEVKPLTDLHPAMGRRRPKAVAAVFVLVLLSLSLWGILTLAQDVREAIARLNSASSDSSAWTISQLEVEHRAMNIAALEARADDAAALQALRDRFDVFYSRVQTVQTTRAFQPLMQRPGFASDQGALNAFLDRTVPLIDGPSVELGAALPVLRADISAMGEYTRRMSLTAISSFAEIAVERRIDVQRALLRLGALVLLLILALMAGLIAMAWVAQISRQKTRTISASQERLSAIINTSLDAIVVSDTAGRIVDFNPAAEDIFGYAKSDILGQRLGQTIIPAHLRDDLEEDLKTFLRTGTSTRIGKARITLKAMRKDGRSFPVEMSISTVVGDKGTLFVSFLRDISLQIMREAELVTARDEAVAGEKAKAHLMAVMSHEMRTPLNGVLGALDLLKGTKLADQQEQLVEVMDTSGDMLLRHVNDVLEISRLDTDAPASDQTWYQPATLAREVVASFTGTAMKNRNTLSLSVLHDPILQLAGDPRTFGRILSNLVGNALKFSSDGQVVVELEVDTHDQSLEIRVIDEGIGIPEADQDRIFDDFVVLDPSFQRAKEGTGLGLGIVRRLVEAEAGTIGVESAPGQGALFWVRLPLPRETAPAVSAPVRPSDARDSQKQALRILMVEDNETNRFVAGEMLRNFGHHVTEAADGASGVARADSAQFDLILMDISMPGMDGIEALKAIKKGGGPNATTPIVALTAHALLSELTKFKKAGFDHVVTKPLTQATLSTALRQVGLNMAHRVQPDNQAMGILTSDDPRHAAMTAQVRGDVSSLIVALNAGLPPDVGATRAFVHRTAGAAAVLGLRTLHSTLQKVDAALECADPTVLSDAHSDLEDVYDTIVA